MSPAFYRREATCFRLLAGLDATACSPISCAVGLPTRKTWQTTWSGTTARLGALGTDFLRQRFKVSPGRLKPKQLLANELLPSDFVSGAVLQVRQAPSG